MATNPGITLAQLSPSSVMRWQRDYYKSPQIGSTNDIVANIDPNGVATGTALTLLKGTKTAPLRRARRFTVTIIDATFAALTPLSVKIEIKGKRWGRPVEEVISLTATSAAAFALDSQYAYDWIDSIRMIGKTNAAAGDVLSVGLEAKSFGLDFPIDSIRQVVSVINVSTNTEAAPVALTANVVKADRKLPGLSYIVMPSNLAVTDNIEVRYLCSNVNGLDSAAGSV